jgi:hypothetical protein
VGESEKRDIVDNKREKHKYLSYAGINKVSTGESRNKKETG